MAESAGNADTTQETRTRTRQSVECGAGATTGRLAAILHQQCTHYPAVAQTVRLAQTYRGVAAWSSRSDTLEDLGCAQETLEPTPHQQTSSSRPGDWSLRGRVHAGQSRQETDYNCGDRVLRTGLLRPEMILILASYSLSLRQ